MIEMFLLGILFLKQHHIIFHLLSGYF
uniref:Uncharacterized protein n=1 Tax=Arundo donax TaxID=35708 RepID=A0A0A9H2U2_ARUDO